MSDGPLSTAFDTTNTKTAIPLLRDGEYATFKLDKLTRETTEKGPSTKWEFELQHPVPASEGGTIEPGKLGSRQFVNIQLYANPGKDQTWFIKKISQYMDALLGTADPENKKGKPNRPQFFVQPVDPTNPQIDPDTVSKLVGQSLVAKMKVKSDGYIGNEFANVNFPGDISA